MIVQSEMLPEFNLTELMTEWVELCKILQAGIQTAQGGRREQLTVNP
jgi:hypothetical protein